MNHNFLESMAKRTNEELIKITTIDRADYQADAILAAEKEIKKRNITKESVEKEKEQITENQNFEILLCPNCGTKLKSGLLSGITLLDNNKVNLINEYQDKKSEFYCTKCRNELYSNSRNKIINDINKLKSELEV